MEQLNIKNFKCFNDIAIDLNKLTVLAGANSRGKSTSIQAFLFLRRTIEHCGEWNKDSMCYCLSNQHFNNLNVELNKNYCLSLGTSSSIIPFDSSSAGIEIGIKDKSGTFSIYYDAGEQDSLYLTPEKIKNMSSDNTMSIFKQQFYYLNAERIGPRMQQEIRFYDYPNTGYQGEYTAQLLGDTELTYRFNVDEQRMSPDSRSAKLEQQVNAWMDYIFPGTSIYAEYNPKTLTAQIMIGENSERTQAPNMGFGISYVLPIIASGLIAQKDAYMVIENPEAHLHPSAQSRIGSFLAIVANSGVKVIIETHSDHVLNGFQLAVLKKQIASKDITINYFSDRESDRQPHVEPIAISETGELSSWPKGFFDQSQRDMAELFRLRKNV